MTQRDTWRLFVRFVLRRAHWSRRAALRDGYHAIYAACVPILNAWFWLRNPVLFVKVKHRARGLRRGVGFLDA